MRLDLKRRLRRDDGPARSGYFPSGLPYDRFGDGPPLIVFTGLTPDNAPLEGMMANLGLRPVRFLSRDHTVYAVGRRPNLSPGYSLEDMADDYAVVVRDELDHPIDVVGISTGGSIAQVFAVRHPELVRRLVVYSAAHTLGPEGRAFQRRCAEATRAGRWDEVTADSMAFMFRPRAGMRRRVLGPLVSLAGRLAARFARPPSIPSDYVITIEAEDAFDLRERLGEITAPTLVVGGTKDPFYTPALFRETAEGIPDGRLLLVDGGAHVPSGRRVTEEIRGFLAPSGPTDSGSAERLTRRERVGLLIHRLLDKWLSPVGVWLLRRTKGGLARPWKADVLLLTTHGRRTGRERTVVLQYFSDGETMVVTAANDGGDAYPGWYHNLIAEPGARIEVDGRRVAVRAEELRADEASGWWARIVERDPSYARFRRATTRPFPILRLESVAPDEVSEGPQ
ncbi:MAG: nitroreductase/quinone reductase family protein [Candidatus Limnocylindrales bacterium]